MAGSGHAEDGKGHGGASGLVGVNTRGEGMDAGAEGGDGLTEPEPEEGAAAGMTQEIDHRDVLSDRILAQRKRQGADG